MNLNIKLSELQAAVNGVEDNDFKQYFEVYDELRNVTLDIPATSYEEALELSTTPKWEAEFEKVAKDGDGHFECPQCYSSDVKLNPEVKLECQDCGYIYTDMR